MIDCVRCKNRGFDYCPECMRPGEEIKSLRERVAEVESVFAACRQVVVMVKGYLETRPDVANDLVAKSLGDLLKIMEKTP